MDNSEESPPVEDATEEVVAPAPADQIEPRYEIGTEGHYATPHRDYVLGDDGQPMLDAAGVVITTDPVVQEVFAVYLGDNGQGQAVIEWDDPTHPKNFIDTVRYGDADLIESYGAFHPLDECPRAGD